MTPLTPNECRVLGVLVEKAQTTPAQYPLTLNALVAGCNQKNNRDPVTELSEDDILEALDGLRAKGLAREVDLAGSRVPKYRHVAREGLSVDTNQLVVLTELLLRGPQTVGEIRGRAGRMHPLESVEVVENILDSLITREFPLVRRLSPLPGTRAERFQQLLCPELHPVQMVASNPGGGSAATARAITDNALQQRVAALEAEVASLRALLEAAGFTSDAV